jgi:hypothetical protein
MVNNSCDWFRQDKETGQWFRVLIRGGGEFTHQVEFPVTPQVYTPSLWKEVREVLVKRTDVRLMTSKDNSRWVHYLPDEVAEKMAKCLGVEQANFLFNGDIYPLIDWYKYNRHGNKGVRLKLCRRDYDWRFEQMHLFNGAIAIDYVSDQTFSLMNAIHTTPDMMLIGGVSAVVDGNYLLIYGYYHLSTGYVCFDLNCSTEGQQHTSKFSQRLKPQWDVELIEFIEGMKSRGDITDKIEASIKSMVWVANNNLATFTINNMKGR